VCVVSVNASQLTTLIVAGCEHVTDTFLLTGFLSDTPAPLNLLSSTAVNAGQHSSAEAAAGSCHSVNNWSVISQRSFSHQLNQCDGLTPFHCKSAADVYNNEPHSSVALTCAQSWSRDHNNDCSDALSFTADHSVTVGAAALRGCQSAVMCGRMNQSVTKYCSRMTTHDHNCTPKSNKLEHLDVSGCWKITDLSVRSVQCLFIQCLRNHVTLSAELCLLVSLDCNTNFASASEFLQFWSSLCYRMCR